MGNYHQIDIPLDATNSAESIPQSASTIYTDWGLADTELALSLSKGGLSARVAALLIAGKYVQTGFQEQGDEEMT